MPQANVGRLSSDVVNPDPFNVQQTLLWRCGWKLSQANVGRLSSDVVNPDPFNVQQTLLWRCGRKLSQANVNRLSSDVINDSYTPRWNMKGASTMSCQAHKHSTDKSRWRHHISTERTCVVVRKYSRAVFCQQSAPVSAPSDLHGTNWAAETCDEPIFVFL